MELELIQKQGLTLAMQASMHILQLNNLQLHNYIGDLMMRNAVVELEYPEIDYRPSPFERTVSRGERSPQDADPSFSKENLMEDKAAGVSALHDLFLQCAAMNLPTSAQRIMKYLIQSLDENGFLSETPENICTELGVPAEQVKKCIELLQGMEPAGVGAADFRECLRIQLLRTTPNQNRLALQIVSSHLEQMAKHQYTEIAKALHVTKAEVLLACDHIRSLNPRPLNGLGGEVFTQYIIPDFYVIEDQGQLRSIMNDYFLPKLKIDLSYRDLIRSNVLSANEKEYIQKSYKEADEVVKFLSYRKTTLQNVVERIITIQGDFFRLGPGHRIPMSNHDLAHALDLHDSTISRAVNGKFFECKWGVFPLKSLFMHATKTEGTSSGNYDQILQKLKELIASEPPNSAYSDQHLADLLCADGIQIARRTVAKYRQILGFPSANRRNQN